MSAYNYYKKKFNIDTCSGEKKYSTLGEYLKYSSDLIMESTWDNNIQSKVCYIYDYKHDDQPNIKDHMTYNKTTKTKIDAKFIVTQYGSITKDQVAYHLMFRPSQPTEFTVNDELYYFEKEYRKKWDITFPISLYCDIPNEKGVYEKWLVISLEQGNQFIKYNVLPVNYLFEWIEVNGQNRYKRYMWGVNRQQNSYSSGFSHNTYFDIPNNITKIFLPFNDITKNIKYVNDDSKNQRFIISAKVDNPLTWRVTKIENTIPNGLLQITLIQDLYNPHTDLIERDDEGNIIGMYADYYDSPILPQDNGNVISPIPLNNNKIIASTFYIKVGGSYKTLTVQLYDNNENDITEHYVDATFKWTCNIVVNGIVTDLTDIVTWANGNKYNQKKIKFPNNRMYLNQILNIKCTVITNTQQIDVNGCFEISV